MKSLTYTIKDESGMHARPAGLLVKAAQDFGSEITIGLGEKSADAKKLFALLSLNIKHGQEITMTAEGEDEEAAIAALKDFLAEHL